MSIRKAATVIPIKAKPDGSFELLLLRRAKHLRVAPLHWVFPGGAIDAEDYGDKPHDELQAALNAASREADEECGLRIHSHEQLPYSYWLTPSSEPVRFATWFSLSVLTDEQPVRLNLNESDQYQWLSPEEGLARNLRGELKLMPPTYISLLEMAKFAQLNDFIDVVKARELPRFEPRMAYEGKRIGDNDAMVLYQEDAAYESLELDTAGKRHRLRVTETSFEYINDHDENH